MPDVVLVHIGCTTGPIITSSRPPELFLHCVQQYFTFNDGALYILTDRENIPYLPKHDKVIPVALEDYHSNKIGRFHAVYEHGVRDFWTACATRFMYLENFLQKNNLCNICHFDNDVLVYFNLADYRDTFQRLYPKLAITPESPQRASAIFMYIDGYEALARMTDFFIEELEQHGEYGLAEMYGTNVMNEMLLISAYEREHKEGLVYLPIIPFGKHSLGYDAFEAIFDPGSWGEVVDGTRKGKTVGWHAPGAYISQLLKQHPSYTVIWETENDLKCPYLKHDGKLTKINNLHIHTKNLAAFVSKQTVGGSNA